VASLQRRFGAVLRRRREQSQLSQEALAERAGVHRNYVGLLERGQRIPSILVVQHLAKALGTTMSDLLEEVES
jgi:transcriptional regulator with XRE-family HTH domain